MKTSFIFGISAVLILTLTEYRMVIGVDAVESSVNMYSLFMGIIVLCLTQFFVHGIELEKNVEGFL